MIINADTFDGTLTLADSDGEEVVVDVLDWFRWNDKEYIVITNDDFEPGEVAVLQVVPNAEGTESCMMPEDEDEEQAVMAEFARRMGRFISLNTGYFD